MPLSLRERGGRLQAFARHNSEGNTRQSLDSINGNSGLPIEKRSEPSKISAPAPLKQEMIETARYPMTKPTRYTAPPLREGSSIGLPPGSSPKVSPKVAHPSPPRPVRARAYSDDRHGGIFSGSQLGDNFMNSGLTTPQNEATDPLDATPEPTPKHKKNITPHQSPERKPVERPIRKSNGASFVLRDDGFMTVITSGPSRSNSTHMKDGFQNGATNGVNGQRKNSDYFEEGDLRPMSPSGRDTKLPLRESSLRRSYASRIEGFDEDPRMSSPTLDITQWQNHQKREDARRTTVFHDLDDDLDSLANSDVQVTPRPKKSKPVAQPTLMESSMPVTNGVRRNSKDKKRRRNSPDYDDTTLTTMTYTDLQKQPFDFDPSKAAEQNGFRSEANNLEAKLDQARHFSEKEQRQFFSNLSIDDWEASGEWFIAQFAGFMHSMREARQKKRRLIQKFEDEAAAREEAVRLRSEVIDRKLAKMKQDGQRVVEDKDL